MNRLFGAFAVLLGIIITVLSGFFINTNTAQAVNENLSLSMKYAENGDIQSAKSELEKALDKWNDKMQTMLLFISHGRLDEIEQTINTAYSYIKNSDISMYSAECTRAYLLIENFKNVEFPSINNIF